MPDTYQSGLISTVKSTVSPSFASLWILMQDHPCLCTVIDTSTVWDANVASSSPDFLASSGRTDHLLSCMWCQIYTNRNRSVSGPRLYNIARIIIMSLWWSHSMVNKQRMVEIHVTNTYVGMSWNLKPIAFLFNCFNRQWAWCFTPHQRPLIKVLLLVVLIVCYF